MARMVEDEDRWQQAFAVLTNSEEPFARAALRRAQHRTWIFVIAILAGALAIGVLVVIFLLGSPSSGSDSFRGQTLAGLVLNLLGAALLVFFLVRQARRGLLMAEWRAPALVLRRGQRRSLGRQVSGREPVDPKTLPLARDVAARTLRGSQLLLMVGLIIQQAGQALTYDSPRYTVFFACLLVLYVVAGARIAWITRRAARFLHDHPTQAQPLAHEG